MKEIKLTQGKFALVSDADFNFLSIYKWQAEKHSHTWYAGTSIKIGSKWKRIRMHRMILKPEKKQIIDHINHNGLDNRRENIRITTQSINRKNSRKSPNLTSQFKGVTFSKEKRKKPWVASIKIGNKYKNLGRFETEIQASDAYKNFVKDLI